MPKTFPELIIDGITLVRETVTKFLGVFIDENVTWKAHIIIISTKISKRILYRQQKHSIGLPSFKDQF